MTITLPDDPALAEFAESDIRLDLACALFAAGRISRGVAARMAGMDRLPFDEELFRRKIPSYTEEMLEEDMATLNKLFPQVIVVTDTSVVLNLCSLQQERLLAGIFGRVLAPPSVMHEFQRLASVDPRFAGLTFPEFIQICTATQIAPALLLNQRLHQGERDALSLAAELGADAVLMDERAGRAASSSLGLQSVGVLGILVQAKRLGFVSAIKPLLDRLQSHARFWIAPALMQQVSRSVGE